MDKILITGGAGFVGSNLAEHLAAEKYEIRILDDFSTGSMKNIHGIKSRLNIIKGSICNPALLEKAVKNCRAIVHLAAQTSVALSVKDPLLTQKVNSEGTLRVLLAARKHGVQKVIFFSSCAVYGDGRSMLPASPYGTTKLAGELYCKTFSELYGLKTVILRPFNIFGPRQNPHSEYSAVIPKFVTALLKKKPPVIFGDGVQTRDFIYVRDITGLIDSLLKYGEKANYGISYDIGSGRPLQIKRLAGMIISSMNSKSRPVHAKARAGEVRHSRADTGTAKKYLGFKKTTPFATALKETISWYVYNQS